MTAAPNAPVSPTNGHCAPASQDATSAPTAAHAAAVAEIAALLAKGLIRAHLAGRNGLALSPESEPSCGANAVNAPRALGGDRDGERQR